MLYFINLPTVVTLLGIGFALASIHFMVNGLANVAWIMLILSGIADLFDGVLARRIPRTEKAAALGVQVDSLADCINFGVVPVGLVYFYSSPQHWIVCILFFFYVTSVVQRLAYFNIYTATSLGKQHYYQGLPVTYSALILPVVFLVTQYFSLWPLVPYVLESTLLLLAIAYIMPVRVPKLRGVWYIVFPMLAVVVSVCLVLI